MALWDAGCRFQIWRIVHHVCLLMARLSIWEANEFAILIPPTFRTDGTLASCSKKPPAPFYAATSLRDSVAVHP